MAVRRRKNIVGQLRIDAPTLREFESAVSNDFDELVSAFITGENQTFVLRGFEISMAGAIGGAANGLAVIVSNSAILHGTSATSGTFFVVPTGTPVEVLNPTSNQSVQGSFAPGTDNYVSIDFEREVDNATSAPVALWDPTNRIEFSRVIPLAKTLKYKFVISTGNFAPNTLPMAVVRTNADNTVAEITDRRSMLFRLGTAGLNTPNPLYRYPWDNQAEGRQENPPSSTSNIQSPFRGGDKMVRSLKEWMDAVMSSLIEIKGTPYWYSPNIGGSISKLRADVANTVVSSRGKVAHSASTAGMITWNHDINFKFVGGQLNFLIQANPSPSTDITLADGEVAYVNLVRDVEILPSLEFTNGSTTVTSVGSVAWTGGLQAGDFVKLTDADDTKWYRIQAVNSASQVTLTVPYAEATTTASATYTWGVYSSDPAPSTDRHIQIAPRSQVEYTDNLLWLYFRDDNGGSTAKVYTKFKAGEVEQGESIEIADNTSLQLLQFIGSTGESDNAPNYTSNIRGVVEESLTDRAGALTDAMGDAQEDRSAYLRSDDIVTWTGEELEFDEDIKLEIVNTKSGTPTVHIIETALSPLELQDGESAWVLVDRLAASEILVVNKTSVTPIPAQTQANKDVFVLFRRQDSPDGEFLYLPLHKQVLSPGQSVRLGASGSGAGVVKVDFYDPVSTELPTTGPTITIDNQPGENGDLVLFSNLNTGNNQVYQLSGVGTPTLSWTMQPIFNGPIPGIADEVRVRKGDSFALQKGVFDGTAWKFNDVVRYFDGTDYWEQSSIKTASIENDQQETLLSPIEVTQNQNIDLDIEDWNLTSPTLQENWRSAAYSPELGLFVAVNFDNGQVARSESGQTWNKTLALGANAGWVSVIWTGSQFVALSETNRTATSLDGVTWTVHSGLSNLSTADNKAIAYSPELGLFVAVNDTDSQPISTSPDAINWTSISGTQGTWMDVEWSPDIEIFVAVARFGANRVIRSSDGVSWSLSSVPTNTNLQKITYSPDLGIFCAIGGGIGGQDRAIVSSDGINWTSSSGPSTRPWIELKWISEYNSFFALSDSFLATSADGLSWTDQQPFPVTTNIDYRALAWSSDLYTLVAFSGTDAIVGPGIASAGVVYNAASIAYDITIDPSSAYDIDAWTTTLAANDSQYRSVTYSPELGRAVAVASGGASDRVMTSENGITWTAQSAPTGSWTSVVWAPDILGPGQGRFVAVAEDNVATNNLVMTSADGLSWTALTGNDSQPGQWNQITYSPELNRVVAVGTANGQTMWSDDLVSWTLGSGTNLDQQFRSVVWAPGIGSGDGLFVAISSIGLDRIATSEDGQSWTTEFSLPLAQRAWTAITYSPELEKFVAVASIGARRVATSEDGVSWTAHVGGDLVSSQQWLAVTWSPELSLFVATGVGASGIMTSADGEGWSISSPTPPGPWEDVIWVADFGSFLGVSSDGAAQNVLINTADYPTLGSPSNPGADPTAGQGAESLPIVYSVDKIGSENQVVKYSISRGASKRTGTLHITIAGNDLDIADISSEINDTGVTFTGTIVDGDFALRYTSTDTGDTGTMKYTVSRWSDAPGGPGGIPSYSGFTGSTISAAGSVGDIQFHGSDGNLAGNPNLKWQGAEQSIDLNGYLIGRLNGPVSLSDNQTSPTVAFSYPATSRFAVIDYSIERGGEFEVGQLLVTHNGTTATLTKTATSTGSLGINFAADLSGLSVRVLYTSTNTGNNAELKYTLKRWG